MEFVVLVLLLAALFVLCAMGDQEDVVVEDDDV